MMMVAVVMPRDDEGQAMPAPTVVARAVVIVITRGGHGAPIVTRPIGVTRAVVMMTLPVAMRVMPAMPVVMTVMAMMPTPSGCGRCKSQAEGGNHSSNNEFRCRFHINQ